MKDQISIRRAFEGEADEISQLTKALLVPHYTREQWEVFVTYYSPEVMREKISRQVFFCAECKGEIVGTIALDDNYVVGFYPRLANLSQGIGAALMQHLEAFALEKPLLEIQLAASPVGLKF